MEMSKLSILLLVVWPIWPVGSSAASRARRGDHVRDLFSLHYVWARSDCGFACDTFCDVFMWFPKWSCMNVRLQGVSCAGGQGGLKDSRTALLLECFRVFDELADPLGPKLFPSTHSAFPVFGAQAIPWVGECPLHLGEEGLHAPHHVGDCAGHIVSSLQGLG